MKPLTAFLENSCSSGCLLTQCAGTSTSPCVPEHNHDLLHESAGVNTGILLLRNDNDFSPKFWDDIAHVSRINQNFNRSLATAEGRIKVDAAWGIHLCRSQSWVPLQTCHMLHIAEAHM